MKVINKNREISISGNVVDEGAMPIALTSRMYEILSQGIYSRPVEAVVRELGTNSWDAHIEAGTDNIPFEVHIPTSLQPWYSVRDFGTGLAKDAIVKIFGAYGASTKTDSNDFNGCLGIGAKSGFAIGDSFSVQSYYNGKEYHYVFVKDETGVPRAKFMGESETSEPNGLLVKIPVNNKSWELKQAAKRVFRYFPVTPKFNLAEVAESIQEYHDAIIQDEDDFVINNQEDGLKAVMGFVAYDIPFYCTNLNISGYLKFDIGQLDFNSGRESLVLNDEMEKLIRDKISKVEKKLCQNLLTEIEKKPTDFEKWQKFRELSNNYYSLVDNNKELFKKYETPKVEEPFVFFSNQGKKGKGTNLYYDADYYLDQPKIVTRVRHQAKTSRKSGIILSEDQIKELGIPQDQIKDASKIVMPKREFKPSKVRTYVFNNSYSNYPWKEKEVELDTEEKVYLEVVRGKSCLTGHQIQEIKTLFEHYRLEFPETLYGVKPAFLKLKKVQNDNFISLKEYIVRELLPKLPEKINISTNHYSNKFNCVFPELDKLISEIEFPKMVMNALGIELEYVDLLKEKNDELIKKYPILKLINRYDFEVGVAEIREYVKLVDKENKNV